MRQIDFEFFKGIKKLNPIEPYKPVLSWNVCEFEGIECVNIEMEFLTRILFAESDLITEEQLDEIDEMQAVNYLIIYQKVDVSADSITKHYKLEGKHDKKANMFFIHKDVIWGNIRKNVELPSGYVYEEEIEGRNNSVIYRIEPPFKL